MMQNEFQLWFEGSDSLELTKLCYCSDTWSCIEPNSEQCGECYACLEREEAFAKMYGQTDEQKPYHGGENEISNEDVHIFA